MDFLLYLVQKDELDIYEVPVHEITQQYIEHMRDRKEADVDSGAEFLASAAFLLYLKSKTLLPREAESEDPFFDELDPKFEIIHHLLDYCRFRDAAKDLSGLEEKQQGALFRGGDSPELPLPAGVDHLSSDDLALLMEDLLKHAAKRTEGLIHEEEYRVGDKIKWLKHLVEQRDRIPFNEVFSPSRPKGELIVTFLAVLELMKLGTLAIIRDRSTEHIFIIPQEQRPEED
ncbi:MAG: segregation/condensation protein A [Chlamydiia bacterium]|nr:segregation/condensation protein A [Chlamydiia bacterium]